LPIRREELALRRDVLEVFGQVGVDGRDVVCLEDIGGLDGRRTELFLVDHNVPTREIRELLGEMSVRGVIDHHVNQHFFDFHDDMIYFTISDSGSCSSLVTSWLSLDPSLLPAAEIPDLARLLLAAILIDTANLSMKFTPTDAAAILFLRSLLPALDTNQFYDRLAQIKHSTQGIRVSDLLRRDYKEFDTPLGKLGMSTISRSIPSLSNESSFHADLARFVRERGLTVQVIMTVTGSGTEFRRGGLVWTERAEVIDRFRELGGNKFGIREDEAVGGGWCFEQGEVTASRKQLAPFICEIMTEVAEGK
jgi:exopolyphosphatase